MKAFIDLISAIIRACNNYGTSFIWRRQEFSILRSVCCFKAFLSIFFSLFSFRSSSRAQVKQPLIHFISLLKLVQYIKQSWRWWQYKTVCFVMLAKTYGSQFLQSQSRWRPLIDSLCWVSGCLLFFLTKHCRIVNLQIM